MATETTDITHEILGRIQADIADLRRDVHANQQNFVDVARVMQRLDARVSDVKADLETMFKMELIGQLSHFETRAEARLESLLDQKLVPVLERLEQLVAR